MTANISRRALLGAAALAPLAAPRRVEAQTQARLVVIGGGFGGASAAGFARRRFPWMEVTLVEPKTRFVTCPYGNLVIGGTRQISDISHGYDGLRARGVRVVHDWAAGIDANARSVRLAGGQRKGFPGMAIPTTPPSGIASSWRRSSAVCAPSPGTQACGMTSDAASS